MKDFQIRRKEIQTRSEGNPSRAGTNSKSGGTKSKFKFPTFLRRIEPFQGLAPTLSNRGRFPGGKLVVMAGLD
jgi:hypothetical protein